MAKKKKNEITTVVIVEEYGYSVKDFVYFGSKKDLITKWKKVSWDVVPRGRVRTLNTCSKRLECLVAKDVEVNTEDYDAVLLTDYDDCTGLYVDGKHYKVKKQG